MQKHSAGAANRRNPQSVLNFIFLSSKIFLKSVSCFSKTLLTNNDVKKKLEGFPFNPPPVHFKVKLLSCLIHATGETKSKMFFHARGLKASSTTLTFVWSSRQAFQANQGTVIRLSLFHTEGKKSDWWTV